jgi:hypothetical protein
VVTAGAPRLAFVARVERDDVVIEARCACGAAARQALDARGLHGDDRARWADADAHAARLRAVAYAMEAAGCPHAFHDPRIVTPCLFRPSRPRAGALREAAGDLGAVGGAEAWEALASRGMVPMAWVDDDARRFVGDDGALSAGPADFAAAAAVAADVDGVVLAEALARELVWRLRDLGLPQPRRLAWRAVDPSFWRPRRGWYLTDELARRARVAPPAAAAPPWWDLARFDVERADAWGSEPGAGPNPFEALAALWLLGYAVDYVSDEAVVLAAPAL